MAKIVQLFKILGVTGCCPHAEGVTFLYAKQSRRGKKYLASSKALQHVPVMLTTPCFRESHRPTCRAGVSRARDRSPAAHQVSRICLLGTLCVTDANTVPLGVTLNKHAGRPQLALHSLSASAQRLFLSVFNGLTAILTWTQAWQEPSWVLHLSWDISSSLYCKYCTVQPFSLTLQLSPSMQIALPILKTSPLDFSLSPFIHLLLFSLMSPFLPHLGIFRQP